MRKLLPLILAFSMIAAATATTISTQNVTADVASGEVTAELNVTSLTTPRFTYLVNHPIESYNVEIDGEEKNCGYKDYAVGGEIRCPTDKKSFNAEVTFQAEGLVQKLNGVRVFRFSQPIYRPIDSYTFRAVLPAGAGVLDAENRSSPVIRPENGEVGTEGRRIYVEWNERPGLSESPLSFEVRYDRLGNPVVVPAAIGAAILAIAAVYIFYRRYPRGPELDEYEEQVVRLLEESDGSMLQKDIVDETELSKAKISETVKGLEEKGLIEKEKAGRSNRVELV